MTQRKRTDGSIAYRAEVVRKRVGLKFVETFDRRKAAQDWIDKKEKELNRRGGLEAAIAAKKGPAKSTLGDAIDRTFVDRVKQAGRTTKDNLRMVQRRQIAGIACEDVTSRPITDLARELHKEGRLPATVGNILSSLGKVFTLADPMWGYPLDEREMEKAVAGFR
jgi:hypothetical protein